VTIVRTNALSRGPSESCGTRRRPRGTGGAFELPRALDAGALRGARIGMLAAYFGAPADDAEMGEIDPVREERVEDRDGVEVGVVLVVEETPPRLVSSSSRRSGPGDPHFLRSFAFNSFTSSSSGACLLLESRYGSAASSGWITLTATSRSSRVSRAR
jgi:hypothetical protein